jgi:hypothetical protein
MSKALRIETEKQIQTKAGELRRDLDFIDAERIQPADIARNLYRIALPEGMSLNQLNDPSFYREINRKFNLLAGDEIQVVGNNFIAGFHLVRFAKDVEARAVQTSFTEWKEAADDNKQDRGETGFFVKYIDPFHRWCVLDGENEVKKSGLYSRELALSELGRMTSQGALNQQIIG